MPGAAQTTATAAEPIPARAGVGLKPQHYADILRDQPELGFFEVHAENYMGAGGPPHRYLTAIRERYPLSIHGVGLSLGSHEALDLAHLDRLTALVQRYEPGLVSEHLAWSVHQGQFLNDLLPLAYTRANLQRLVEHVEQVQTALKVQLLIENPATYVCFSSSEMSEAEFLQQLARRSGCGLLLDVNNVFVSASNHAYSASHYLEQFPTELVAELHIAGHSVARDELGDAFLVDSHDQAVIADVWQLLEQALTRTGPLPVLLERDGNIPDWSTLAAEADIADVIIRQHCLNRQRAHVSSI